MGNIRVAGRVLEEEPKEMSPGTIKCTAPSEHAQCAWRYPAYYTSAVHFILVLARESEMMFTCVWVF